MRVLQRATWLVLATTAMVVLRPSLPAAYALPATQPTPPTTRPEQPTAVLAPAGTYVCQVAGTGEVLAGGLAVRIGIPHAAVSPADSVIDNLCHSVPAPSAFVACPVDNLIGNAIFTLPTPVALPVPLPSPTVFGITLETLRALATLIALPGLPDPAGSLLGCTTIPGLPGTTLATPTTTPTTTPDLQPLIASPPVMPKLESAPPADSVEQPLAATPHAINATPAAAARPAPPPLPALLRTPAARFVLVLLLVALLCAGGYAWRRARGPHPFP